MMDLDFDRQHLWHPYSNINTPGSAFPVVSAQGIRLGLEDGTQLIDAMSSWWAAIHGHRHPALMRAAHVQLESLPHVMFGGLTHAPAIDLGRRLLALAPEGMTRVFYADSGSVAVEVAMKMAVQYQRAIGQEEKTGFITPRGGYHGDTWKAMSVCDPETGMHHLFRGALGAAYFVPRPPVRFGGEWPEDEAENGIGALRALLEVHHARIAALILEPVVQGAGGLHFYHPRYLDAARTLCDDYGLLLIHDEIATGFGRTGRLWGSDHAAARPDILCLGKALTGGVMTLSAVLTQEHVARGIGSGQPGMFMHGPTFMANPLACAVACASLDLIAQGAWPGQVSAMEMQMKTELAPARTLPGVKDVRVLGGIGVIEMDHGLSADAAHPLARATGVYLRPFGRNIYAMPPYITGTDDLSRMTAAMIALAKVL